MLEPDPWKKATLALAAGEALKQGDLDITPDFQGQPVADLPDHPPRLDKPPLLPPGRMPKRKLGSNEGRARLIHAIAHIELNAINLAFDLICRFSIYVYNIVNTETYAEFLHDWFSIGMDEARHFHLLADRLETMGYPYGSLPAHGGLWDIATRTQDDLLARLALAPMVMEARGLDVTPSMIKKLRTVGDEENAAALTIILQEEVRHVEIGARWFRHFARLRDLQPDQHFRALVRARFPGGLKPPFNHEARQMAGLGREFYENLNAE